ncbi:unnamed protein product, partial [Heterotrigona itama]
DKKDVGEIVDTVTYMTIAFRVPLIYKRWLPVCKTFVFLTNITYVRKTRDSKIIKLIH